MVNQIGLRKEKRMKINKKYVVGSVAVLALSVCSYELGRYQAGQVKKDSNRVAYIDGDQAGQKAENLTPDEVSKREGINAEQIVIDVYKRQQQQMFKKSSMKPMSNLNMS